MVLVFLIVDAPSNDHVRWIIAAVHASVITATLPRLGPHASLDRVLRTHYHDHKAANATHLIAD